jgi:tetratricopeptide (TPR) repeat protein
MSYGGGEREAAAAVLRKELAAKLALARRRGDEAVKLAREAAAAEDAMSFEFGPPVVVKPAHELAGEILLDLGRPAEARQEFELSLARAPRRALSLLGLARAASKAGEAEVARRSYGELKKVWRRADAELPELSELPPL